VGETRIEQKETNDWRKETEEKGVDEWNEE
jgi:hypothetical protein